MRAAGGLAFALRADVTSPVAPDDIAVGLEKALRDLGRPPVLDVLVNKGECGLPRRRRHDHG